MAQATAEMSHYGEYEYLVINDDFESACTELTALFLAPRLTREAQQARYSCLIPDLLKA